MINNEDDILDILVRQRLIKAINNDYARKAGMWKRYQCYKDKTFLYVIDHLLRQFSKATVNEMQYALSNLAICRKIVDKLARVYKYGVERDIMVDGEEFDNENIVGLNKVLKFDQAMKKTNRYYKLFRNTVLYIRPKPVTQDPDSPFTIAVNPLAPYLYDPILLNDEQEHPCGYILSEFNPNRPMPSDGGPVPVYGMAALPGTDGRDGNAVPFVRSGDVTQPEVDKDKKYIFWTANYHFTTDRLGNIVDGPEDLANPIGAIPFVNYTEDQDGNFWAEGGDDLVDGAVLVNSMITNINHIAITQGYGQLVMTGKDIPSVLKLGPNSAVRLTHEEGDPIPSFKFESANPPLDQLRGLIEMYVALLLTTNNLSTSGVASNLNGNASFASGIAMLIDKSEAMEDIEDQRQIFQDNEPLAWDLIGKWMTYLRPKNELDPKVEDFELPDVFDLVVTYNDPKPIETESDRLKNLQLKQQLGLISLVDMIKSEYPDLTDDQAKAKLADIIQQKVEYGAAQMMPQQGGAQDGSDGGNDNLGSDVGDPEIRPGSGQGDPERDRGLPRGAGAPEGGESEKPGNGG